MPSRQSGKGPGRSDEKDEQRPANICSPAEVKLWGFEETGIATLQRTLRTEINIGLDGGFETAEILLYSQCFERALDLGYWEHWQMEANWDQDPHYVYEAFGEKRKP